MFLNMLGDRIAITNRCRQNEGQLVLTNGVTRAILDSGFRAAVSQTLEPEHALVEVRRLLGVADIKFDMIRAFQRQKILLGCRSTFLFWSSNCCCHKLPR